MTTSAGIKTAATNHYNHGDNSNNASNVVTERTMAVSALHCPGHGGGMRLSE